MRLDDYTAETVSAYLEHLHEIRALVLTGDGHEGTGPQAHLRESFFCVLWDLENAMRQLPLPLREAVYWSYEQALTDREAASHIGICHRALQKRLARAVECLAEILTVGRHTPPIFTLTYMEAMK